MNKALQTIYNNASSDVTRIQEILNKLFLLYPDDPRRNSPILTAIAALGAEWAMQRRSAVAADILLKMNAKTDLKSYAAGLRDIISDLDSRKALLEQELKELEGKIE